MKIERNYYDETQCRLIQEEETEDKQAMAQMVKDLEKYLEKRVKIPDSGKQAWFEGLADDIIRFSEACNLNVKAWITDDYYGIIQLETGYFELDGSDPPGVHAFWAYLQQTADLFNISSCDEYFRMEFQFYLFSLHETE